MEKFTEFHVGSNKINIEAANYLVEAYKVSDTEYNLLTVPVARHIFLDMKVKLTSLRDALLVQSMVWRGSVGDYAMVYDSFDKAKKGIEKLESQHIDSLFGG